MIQFTSIYLIERGWLSAMCQAHFLSLLFISDEHVAECVAGRKKARVRQQITHKDKKLMKKPKTLSTYLCFTVIVSLRLLMCGCVPVNGIWCACRQFSSLKIIISHRMHVFRSSFFLSFNSDRSNLTRMCIVKLCDLLLFICFKMNKKCWAVNLLLSYIL